MNSKESVSDMRTDLEKRFRLEHYSIHCVDDVVEKVVPKVKKENEFPAQTLRRTCLEGLITPKDINRIYKVGPKGMKSLMTMLGLIHTSDNRFIEP
jgi:hypothetical protein